MSLLHPEVLFLDVDGARDSAIGAAAIAAF